MDTSIKRERSSSLPRLSISEHESNHRKSSFKVFTKTRKKLSVFDKRSHPHQHRCCATTRMCWWEPNMEDINDTVDFTQETSLHGLKFICQPKRHLLERIFWLIAFISAVIIAGFLISEIWMNYWNSPVIVTFQPFETTIDKIPFPAITICNMNKVLKSKAQLYMKNPDKKIHYIEHVCSTSKSFSQKFNYTSKRGQVPSDLLESVKIKEADDEQEDVAVFLNRASQKCSEMMPLCLWQDEPVNCSLLFKPIETDFGKCCTFNMIPRSLLFNLTDKGEDPIELEAWKEWDYEKDGLLMQDTENSSRAYPRRQFRAGKTSGLSIVLNPDLPEYFCTSSDSQGFRLVKHLPLEMPHVVDFGLAIRPNSEIFIGIRPEITMADPDIRSFRLEKRNCYFRGEYNLAYFKYYTSSNCNDECQMNLTYDECKCVRYYMPRMENDTRDLCGPSKFNCVEIVRKMSLKTGKNSNCGHCLPTCTEVEYFSETTVTPIQKDVNVWYNSNNTLAKWGHKNVTIVHIYFASDSTYARVRKELYGITDLIANTGGLMGLCLGFSGLSLIELLYFYSLRAWCRTRRRKTIWNIVAIKLHQVWLRAQARSDRYGNSNGCDTKIGSNPSIRSGISAINRPGFSETVYGGFDEPKENDNEDGNRNKPDPFIVVDRDSKPGWGKFSGFGTKYGNSYS